MLAPIHTWSEVIAIARARRTEKRKKTRSLAKDFVGQERRTDT